MTVTLNSIRCQGVGLAQYISLIYIGNLIYIGIQVIQVNFKLAITPQVINNTS